MSEEVKASAAVTAKQLKDEGNRYFGEQRFALAEEAYNNALLVEDATKSKELEAVLFSNLAGVQIKLGKYDDALSNSRNAFLLRPEWPKGYFRHACALVGLQRHHDALLMFQRALSNDPANEEVLQHIRDVTPLAEEEMRRIQSDSAIYGVIVRHHLKLQRVDMSTLDVRSFQSFHPPVFERIGLPIRLALLHPFAQRKGDNQFATYCMIKISDGFAPPMWQEGKIGPVLLYRTDGISLSQDEVLGLWDFLNIILENYGSYSKHPDSFVNRAAFLKWQEKHNDSQHHLGTSKISLL